MSNNSENTIKSTIDLITENNKIDNNKDRKEEGNIDINRNYEEEPIKSKKKNIDMNAEPTKEDNYYTYKGTYNGLDENNGKIRNSNPSSNEKKVLDIVEDINNHINEFQMIPLYIQKGNEEKFLLVKKNMTLKEIIFINFKEDDADNYTFYNGKNIVNKDKTIEELNITPLSHITDYRVIKQIQ